jgi:hypothetical protein
VVCDVMGICAHLMTSQRQQLQANTHLCAHAWKCALSGGILYRIHPRKALARAR